MNAYFEGLKEAGAAWETARQERMERKERIIEEHGWDSDELKAWYEENEAAKFPFAQGEVKAYRAWENSMRLKEDEIEMNDFLWDREVEDFIGAFRKAGIKTFVYTNESTAVMDNLHDFVKAGCTMMGLCTTTRTADRWGTEEAYEVRGIRFSVN